MKEYIRQNQHNFSKVIAVFIVLASLLLYAVIHSKNAKKVQQVGYNQSGNFIINEKQCLNTCSLEIVESIPQNLTFEGHIPRSTFAAWSDLLTEAHSSIYLAAYKSSLRGRHVFRNQKQAFSAEGEAIYELLKDAGLGRKLSIKMVENGPSKDKGDNEDGQSLESQGVLQRRILNLKSLLGSGTMHSKFIVVDNRDFYLGSANLDWRSLNQKMELGLYVKNCDCLAQELTNIFDTYWHGASANSIERFVEIQRSQPAPLFNMQNPLTVNYENEKATIYLATSPKPKNNPSRTWDLDAIVHEISQSKKYLYVHVMDYFPIFMYSKNNHFWPVIDNALRAAILRGVEVKLLVAALHSPEISLKFIKSLETLKGVKNAKIEAKIFKVPTSPDSQNLMKRERRTHNKFLVTDHAVIIGTSNWAADYFESKGTGVAIVIEQKTKPKKLINKMKDIFIRDWTSNYTHSIDEYVYNCIDNQIADYCENQKDPSLLAEVTP